MTGTGHIKFLFWQILRLLGPEHSVPITFFFEVFVLIIKILTIPKKEITVVTIYFGFKHISGGLMS